MKWMDLVSNKGAVAVGLVIGLTIGGLVGYFTYTQVITTVLGSRQVEIIRYEELLRIVTVEMDYDADGNIDQIDVTVRNIDDVNTRNGIATAGSMGATSALTEFSLLPGEEKTVSLEITPPIVSSGEETIILVGIQEVTA